MKEPSIKIITTQPETVSSTVNGSEVAAGVIIADNGSIEPTLITKASDLVSRYTKSGRLTRDCDTTLVHAYAALSVGYPVLVCRSTLSSSDKKGVLLKYSNGAFGDPVVVFKKNGVILDNSMKYNMNSIESITTESFGIQVNNVVYYAGTLGSPQDADSGIVLKKLSVDKVEGKSALECIIDAINTEDSTHHLDIASVSSDSAVIMIYGVSGEVAPTKIFTGLAGVNTDQYVDTKVLSDPNNPCVALFSNYPNTRDFKGSISPVNNNPRLVNIKVSTLAGGSLDNPDRDYEGSLNKGYVNQYGVDQYIENINSYPNMEFEIEVLNASNDPDRSYEFTPVTFSFGGQSTVDSGKSLVSRQKALDKIADMEDYKIAFMMPFNYTNPSYLNYLATKASKCYSLGVSGVYVEKDDVNTIKPMLPTRTEDLFVLAGSELSTSLADFPVKLNPEILYLQRVAVNKATNKEFAPVMGSDTGLMAVTRVPTKLKSSTREALLDLGVNSIITKATTGVSYLNKNKCFANSDNIMNEEQNKRLALKINRDIDELLDRFLGKENNEDTRSLATSLVNQYFNDYIMNQVYNPVSVEVVCNDTNNPDTVINSNKLVLDISIRYPRTIYDILVYHRAKDVS